MKLQTIHGMKFRVVSTTTIKQDIIRWSVADTDTTWCVSVFDSVTSSPLGSIWHHGVMSLYPGYMFDGPSGPTRDDSLSIGPAAWHDLCYEVIRRYGEKLFTRKQADLLMLQLLLDNVDKATAADGKPWYKRAWAWTKRKALRARFKVWYAGLRVGAAGAARRRVGVEPKYRVIEVM